MALKEKEIQERIKNAGFERGTMWCLLEMAGEIKQLEANLVDCSKQLDQMASLMAQFVNIAGNMKEAHQTLLRRMSPDVDGPRPSDDRDLN